MTHQPLVDSKLRTESLNLLRFPLAVVVVMMHIFGTNEVFIGGQPYAAESFPIFSELQHLMEGFLRGQSVPIYFFISGYVFFWGIALTRETYLRKLKNRSKTLLIPYLIWNTLALLQMLVLSSSLFQSLFTSGSDPQLDTAFPNLLRCFWGGATYLPADATAAASDAVTATSAVSPLYPINPPLWFLRNLMIIVLTAPALYYILKHTRHYVLVLLGLLWFAKTYVPMDIPLNLLTGYFFFSWGAYMSIHSKDMLVEFGKYFRPSVFLYVFLSLSYVASVHWFPAASATLKQLNIFVGLIFAYNLASWLLRRQVCRPNAFLASASFFIYVSHTLVWSYILRILFKVMPLNSDLGVCFVYSATLVITIGLLLLAFWLMRRYTPGLLRVVAGKK